MLLFMHTYIQSRNTLNKSEYIALREMLNSTSIIAAGMAIGKAITTLSSTGAITMLGATLADKATFIGNYGNVYWLGALFVAIGVAVGLVGRRIV